MPHVLDGLTSDKTKFTERDDVPHFASSLNSSHGFFSLWPKGEKIAVKWLTRVCVLGGRFSLQVEN